MKMWQLGVALIAAAGLGAYVGRLVAGNRCYHKGHFDGYTEALVDMECAMAEMGVMATDGELPGIREMDFTYPPIWVRNIFSQDRQ